MIAFAHIQKTGGTTVVGLLRRNLGPLHCDVEPVVDGPSYYATTYGALDHATTRRLWPGLVSIAGHRVKPTSDLDTMLPDVRYHTWVRGPVARAASHFQHVVQRLGHTEGFDAWTRQEQMQDLMCRHLGGSASCDAAREVIERTGTFVGVLDHFDESLVLLREWVGRPNLDIRYERRNVARDDSTRRGLVADPRTRAMLEDMNRQDQALHAWVTRELWPSYRAAYGEARLVRDVEALRASVRTRRWSAREISNRVVRNAWYKPALRAVKAVRGAR